MTTQCMRLTAATNVAISRLLTQIAAERRERHVDRGPAQGDTFHPVASRQVDRSTSRLRSELDGGLEAAVHVEGNGLVLVRDLPRTPDPPEAERVTKPDAGLLALGGRPAQSVETV